ncbi:MAG: hypothetical protein ACREBD_07585 [Blastocatellia bacterium]
MLTTIEAEIDVNGNVTLLEPIRLSRKIRAIVTLLESDNVTRKPLSEEEKRLAEERFARWIGARDSGDPNSADNERIDADLAREYGAGLDE